jgi:hypothetical protein
VYASPDLTPLEQERKKEITRILKAEWGVAKIPNGRFVRDCIKCTIDNENKMAVCNLEQVKEYLKQKRIKPY